MGDGRPALEYLLACSDVSLESFRISRMSRAANLRKQVRALVDEWVEAEVDAGVSRWVLQCRRTDAVLSVLELDYPSQNKSVEHVTISFRPGRVEASVMASQQKRLSTGLGEVEDACTCPSTDDGTVAPGQCKNASHAHAMGLRKPYAKPIARKRPTAALEEIGTIAIPVRSSPKAQQELTFEGPLVSGTTTHETSDAETPKS
jgi:hypothetical protein